jgi:neuronal growth regulator 1
MNILQFSLIFIALIVIKDCTAQRTPSISYISQEQIKDIGGTVELDW